MPPELITRQYRVRPQVYLSQRVAGLLTEIGLEAPEPKARYTSLDMSAVVDRLTV